MQPRFVEMLGGHVLPAVEGEARGNEMPSPICAFEKLPSAKPTSTCCLSVKSWFWSAAKEAKGCEMRSC